MQARTVMMTTAVLALVTAVAAQRPASTDDAPLKVTGCLERVQPMSGGAAAARGPATAGRGAPARVTDPTFEFRLRVGAADTTGATPRTGMPSAGGGMSDERAEAGKIGTTVHHLRAGTGVDLAAHVGHMVEVTAAVADRTDAMAGGKTKGRDRAASSQSPSQAGTSGAASPATGAMPITGEEIDGGVLEVTAIRMIADSCS